MDAVMNDDSGRPRLHQDTYGHFIGGQWVEGASGRLITLLNPATGAELAAIQAGDATDAKRAVDAAYAAFPAWSRTGPGERQAILNEMARRLRARVNDYAMLETVNNGKPISESLHFDMPIAIDQFMLFSGTPWSIEGRTASHPGRIGIVHREPLGVVAQIIPWNVPMVMMAAKLAPALAAGNTVVLKPSEIVCLSVLEFFREMADLLPPGVINLVTGYGQDVGEALVTDSRVRKVAFTGSRETARKLIQYASVNIIPQTMELGGKSAAIICDDADIESAAEGAAMSVVLNKGEVCLSGSRTFVHDRVYDRFLDRFSAILDGIRIGDPTDARTQLGAQASRAQFEKILGYLDLGPQEGARALRGGHRASGEGLDAGFFIQPTIFVDVRDTMRIAREEIFGPVASVMRWSDEEDVIRRANDSDYGLAGGIWTRDLTRAHRMSQAMETGTVWINGYYNVMTGQPFGGYKQSGFGREFAHEVLEHYTHTKSVIINMNEGPLGMFR